MVILYNVYMIKQANETQGANEMFKNQEIRIGDFVTFTNTRQWNEVQTMMVFGYDCLEISGETEDGQEVFCTRSEVIEVIEGD
jgi:hypothetical protein